MDHAQSPAHARDSWQVRDTGNRCGDQDLFVRSGNSRSRHLINKSFSAPIGHGGTGNTRVLPPMMRQQPRSNATAKASASSPFTNPFRSKSALGSPASNAA